MAGMLSEVGRRVEFRTERSMATTQLSFEECLKSMPSSGAMTLPKGVLRVNVPPIKCQGIKTKLVPFILSSIKWSGAGRWVEPFVGSGVVLFNVAPARAYVTDTNEHIIRLYRDIASSTLTPEKVRAFLAREGVRLSESGGTYYYEVRERFNARPSSLDFLFLNRSCFNGVIRFNRKGKFNVPFCRKPDRFAQAYVTKITNQVGNIARLMRGREWVFDVTDWRSTLDAVQADDFVYADPPYYGRHTDYYNAWGEDDADNLFKRLRGLPAGFALSTWKENKYRSNPQLEGDMSGVTIRTINHFYHVGPKEELRNMMEEALVIRDGFAAG